MELLVNMVNIKPLSNICTTSAQIPPTSLLQHFSNVIQMLTLYKCYTNVVTGL